MNIRRARQEDIRYITGLTQRAWEGFTKAELTEKRHGIRGGKSWYEHKSREIRDFCDNHLNWVLVAEENGRVVGYATYALDNEKKTGIVGNNAVDPACRGKGIGSALHNTVLERFREAGMEIAEVVTMEIDAPARRVYEKHGFKELFRSIHYTQKL